MTFIKFLMTKSFVKQLLIAIVVLVVLVFLVLWWLRMTTNHNQQIEVPNLAKMSMVEAQDMLEDMDLRFEVIDSTNYNPEYPKRSIIEQIPAAGKFVKENRKIYLTLNRSSYAKIQLPEVVGKTKRQAEPTLKAMGFAIGKVIERPHISDHVLELRHDGKKVFPGSELPKTSVIDLVVGDQTLSRVNTSEDEDNSDSESDDNDEGRN